MCALDRYKIVMGGILATYTGQVGYTRRSAHGQGWLEELGDARVEVVGRGSRR